MGHTHYMESDGEVYSVGPDGGQFGADDRKVAFILTEDELPVVTRDGNYLRVEGASGTWPDRENLTADMTYEKYTRAMVAIIQFRAKEREERESMEVEKQRWVDLLNEIDPNPHGWYSLDGHLVTELVRRGITVPSKEEAS